MSKFIVTTEVRAPKGGEYSVVDKRRIGIAVGDFPETRQREVIVGVQELHPGESYHLYDAKHPHPDDPTIEAIFRLAEVKL